MTQPGEFLADVIAQAREAELDAMEPAPVSYRSRFEEFQATGRYPINPLASVHAYALVERRRQYLAVQSAMERDL